MRLFVLLVLALQIVSVFLVRIVFSWLAQILAIEYF